MEYYAVDKTSVIAYKGCDENEETSSGSGGAFNTRNTTATNAF
jgi:hypothetical protein